MCGIFGSIATERVNISKIKTLVDYSRQRGIDSSGISYFIHNEYFVKRANYDVRKLINKVQWQKSSFTIGHSRLVTNGLLDNQPVVRDGIILIHNGIIVNENEIWNSIRTTRNFEIDSEVIIGLTLEFLAKNKPIGLLSEYILTQTKGSISAALAIPKLGKLLLFSNNGSLYYGLSKNSQYFASEKFPLTEIGCEKIVQIDRNGLILDIPMAQSVKVEDLESVRVKDLIPELKNDQSEKDLLIYEMPNLKRCKRCILPETMPFIEFDDKGICNYCHNYKSRNVPKPKEELFNLVEPYRKDHGAECIVPLSGGRDSMYSLHLVVNELKMKPITYTYDWGMVTDLARRNISRICEKLGVENIIVAADIDKKRDNIRKNLKAWLKKPHLGMVSILTAGDKHFFKYLENIKKQTGISLNLWGTNPLEVTHFKAGFLGIKPALKGKEVYISGTKKQLHYQKLRFKEMLKNPKYFNSSLWDTLSGEYYRSVMKKTDYFHVYDYWRWKEDTIEDTLINEYGFERAPDTNTTWRIGDGTAAFYNYIYYTVAGFTEHDTFRSNQIREGQLSRVEALKLVNEENKPRYQNIRWYLDTMGFDFKEVILIINNINKLY